MYLDETWVDQNQCRKRAWYPEISLVDDVMKNNQVGFAPLPNIPSGKGKRIVVLHVGGAEIGFIPQCEMVFQGIHDDMGDYHTEMNSVLFMSWFDDLIKTLEQPTVIVLDNASYHNTITEESKSPNMSTKKADMRQWLDAHNVDYQPEWTKAVLYEAIKANKPPKVYRTDVIAEQVGHIVLRTPPRQCYLNAIELIWAQVKQYVSNHNTGMKVKGVLELTKEAIQQVTREKWQKVVDHTIKVEEAHWKRDGLTEEIDPVVVHLGSEDESSDSEEESEENERDTDETQVTFFGEHVLDNTETADSLG